MQALRLLYTIGLQLLAIKNQFFENGKQRQVPALSRVDKRKL